MLVLSVTLVRHRYGELVLNLALLLVVVPGALGVALLLRERRNASP